MQHRLYVLLLTLLLLAACTDPVQNPTLSVEKTGNGTGVVTSEPAGIDCGDTCSTSFEKDASVTLTASAADGSRFASWGGACSGSAATCTLTVSESQSVSASFEVLGASETLERSVNSSSDDAEEILTANEGDKDLGKEGKVDLTSGDLELTLDLDPDNQKNRVQLIGMRFDDIDIPTSAIITKAYIQFAVDEVDTGAPANLVIEGEASDAAVSFSSTSGDLSGRPKTTAQTLWSPASWTVAGDPQQSSDIKDVIQEIVNRPGWASGNALVLFVRGDGQRIARSFDGDAAPLLHIEYIP